jgi:hypothetical protein
MAREQVSSTGSSMALQLGRHCPVPRQIYRQSVFLFRLAQISSQSPPSSTISRCPSKPAPPLPWPAPAPSSAAWPPAPSLRLLEHGVDRESASSEVAQQDQPASHRDVHHEVLACVHAVAAPPSQPVPARRVPQTTCPKPSAVLADARARTPGRGDTGVVEATRNITHCASANAKQQAAQNAEARPIVDPSTAVPATAGAFPPGPGRDF